MAPSVGRPEWDLDLVTVVPTWPASKRKMYFCFVFSVCFLSNFQNNLNLDNSFLKNLEGDHFWGKMSAFIF